MASVSRPVCGDLVVGTVVSYFDHKRRAKGGKARLVDPVVIEILEALLALGGCAHRQMVADQIAQRRSGRSGPAGIAARNEIYAAFDAYLAWAVIRKTTPLLDRPLGEGSYRWALTDAGRRLFQSAQPAVRMVR
ncbi:MAG: outer membrane efflux protein [bacterium]|nr:MAG: outer membrane efflux protein [bacterium]